MKIRSGFVSNSSTASYVIMGVTFDSQEEFTRIARALLGEPEKEEKPKLTDEEKIDKLLDYWDTLSNKPVGYYKNKCGEATNEELLSWYDQVFDDDDDEEDDEYYELMDALYDSDWEAECNYYNVIGYQLAYTSSDGGMSSEEIDFEKMQEKVRFLEEVTGKKAKILSYVTEG